MEKIPPILLAQIYYPMSIPFKNGNEILFREAKGVVIYHCQNFTIKKLLKNALKEFEK